ncbi:MAG: hypothetical protein K6E50_11225 [Lachnospiraceae bacterium]|nr:hypothetical protein [Lachnospiraceae bacterium]
MKRFGKRILAFCLILFLLGGDFLPICAGEDEPAGKEEAVSENTTGGEDAEGSVAEPSEEEGARELPVPVPTPLPGGEPAANPETMSGNEAAVSEQYADLSAYMICMGGFPEESVPDAGGEETLPFASDLNGARNAIYKGVKSWSRTIDLSPYSIQSDSLYHLYLSVINSHMELFYVDGGLSWGLTKDGIVTEIRPSYKSIYSKASVKTFNQKVDEIMELVPEDASDLEKVIIFHDYIVNHCQYDTTISKPGIYDAYGALVKGLAVCNGYASGYECLLSLSGIEGQLITSKVLDHAWNVLKLDGKWYYVDCTWDETNDEWTCRHENLLRSLAGMRDTGHEGEDWTGSEDWKNVYHDIPGDTHYDAYFWQDWRRTLPVAQHRAAILTESGILVYDLQTESGRTYPIGAEGLTAITAVAGTFYFSTPEALCSLSVDGKWKTAYALTEEQKALGIIGELEPLSYGVKYFIIEYPYFYDFTVVGTGIYIIDGLPVPTDIATPTPTEVPTVTPTPTGIPTAKDDKLLVEFAGSGEYVYSGKAVMPDINVFYRGRLLCAGTDYTVKYSNNVNVGDEALATVSGKALPFTSSHKFRIVPKDIGERDVRALPVAVMSGEKAVPALYYGTKKLGSADITYGSESFSEDGTLTVQGKGNYCGSREIAVTVMKETGRKFRLSFKPVKRVYNGEAQKLSQEELLVYDASTGAKLRDGADYHVVYPIDTVNAGTVAITVVGIGKYSGSVGKSYKIAPLSASDIELKTEGECTFRPGGCSPEITLWRDGRLLEQNRDYKLSLKSNKAAGTGKYSITFTGNYKGTPKKEGTFVIKAAAFDEKTVVLIPDQVYKKSGKYFPAPYVSLDGTALPKAEYDVEYYIGDRLLPAGSKLTDADLTEGEVTIRVKISGKKDMSGTAWGEYRVSKAEKEYDLANAKISIIDRTSKKAVKKLPYTGEPVVIGGEQELVVTIGKDRKQLKEGEDFEVFYVNNVNKGSATILLKGIGNYSGSRKGNFRIVKGIFPW